MHPTCPRKGFSTVLSLRSGRSRRTRPQRRGIARLAVERASRMALGAARGARRRRQRPRPRSSLCLWRRCPCRACRPRACAPRHLPTRCACRPPPRPSSRSSLPAILRDGAREPWIVGRRVRHVRRAGHPAPGPPGVHRWRGRLAERLEPAGRLGADDAAGALLLPFCFRMVV